MGIAQRVKKTNQEIGYTAIGLRDVGHTLLPRVQREGIPTHCVSFRCRSLHFFGQGFGTIFELVFDPEENASGSNLSSHRRYISVARGFLLLFPLALLFGLLFFSIFVGFYTRFLNHVSFKRCAGTYKKFFRV